MYLYVNILKHEIMVKAEVIVEINGPSHCIVVERPNIIIQVVYLNCSYIPR